MDRQDRRELKALASDVRSWVKQATAISVNSSKVRDSAGRLLQSLIQRGAVFSPGEERVVRVVPLRALDQTGLLAPLARRANLPRLSGDDTNALELLLGPVAQQVDDLAAGTGIRGLFAGEVRRAQSESAAKEIPRIHYWGLAVGLPAKLLAWTSPQLIVEPSSLGLEHVLDPRLGLASDLTNRFGAPWLLDHSTLAYLTWAVDVIGKASSVEAAQREAARKAGTVLRQRDVNRLVDEMPVERLREATRNRIRTTPLTSVGIRTVLQVLQQQSRLIDIPGLGDTTVARIVGAAQSLWQATYDEMPVRIDISARQPEATTMLKALASWDALRRARGPEDEARVALQLAPIAEVVAGDTTHALVLPLRANAASEFTQVLRTVFARAKAIHLARQEGAPTVASDPWLDFLGRPADYFTMLAELGFSLEDEEKVHGDLPQEIVDAIRRQELRTEHLKASLRGYQAFAARFALVQRKVIIGDEMGLGKTIEALAVLAHLRSTGHHHFLVICPAAVVTNWTREVSQKSTLRAHRLHGPGRDSAAGSWIRNGGVAVSTFESLGWLRSASGPTDLACVVIDEAHFVKNPNALRTERTLAYINSAERAILLTGTPLENRVEEFRNLASYVRPDLVLDATDLAPKRFRRQIAPAYLRRNQEDVLAELPELVEVEEWLPLTQEDHIAYASAVYAGNFMAMRQAAMLSGSKSQKIQRLLEIAEEAEANGRRVIVFSYFREVLSQLAHLIPGPVHGPITGSVPAALRQTMVDTFSSSRHGAVLLAQIVAGGVGLNIQSASVVVICEPQLKPTLESQAIARAHRMGQVQSVQVHRLLSEVGVDQRVTEILAAKRQLFDEFARDSDLAASAPEALDVSEAELARQVVADERERLFRASQSPS